MTAAFAAIRLAVRDSFIGGSSLFWLAPAIPLLLLVPEMAQHVVEIRLGMFDSLEAARSVSQAPMRWAFGYVKIAGLVLTALAAARYWGGLRERWWDMRTVAWPAFLMGLAINVVLTGVNFAIERIIVGDTGALISQAFTAVTAPFLLLLIGPLLGEVAPTLRQAYTRGWLALVLMIGLAAVAFAGGGWLHTMNHRWAIGAAPATVWALMIWDAIWTALFVTCAGSALGAGYRAVLGRRRSGGGDQDAPLAAS